MSNILRENDLENGDEGSFKDEFTALARRVFHYMLSLKPSIQGAGTYGYIIIGDILFHVRVETNKEVGATTSHLEFNKHPRQWDPDAISKELEYLEAMRDYNRFYGRS